MVGISYKKLWVKLAEMEIDKVRFRKQIGFSPNTMTKLNKNDEVSLNIILKICAFLQCNIGDICDTVIIEEVEEE